MEFKKSDLRISRVATVPLSNKLRIAGVTFALAGAGIGLRLAFFPGGSAINRLAGISFVTSGAYALIVNSDWKTIQRAWAESHFEQGRRIGAEMLAEDLQRRLATLMEQQAEVVDDSEGGCSQCRVYYDRGVQDALQAAKETAAGFEAHSPAPGRSHLKLVKENGQQNR